jgi:outer membrane immunogenic protein
MQKTSLFATAVVSILAFGAPATAQDWTGFYAGVFAGVPLGDNTWEERGVPTAATPGDFEGTVGGIVLGYDQQVGTWLWGVALDASFGDILARGTDSPGFGCFTGFCNTEVTDQVTLRGRIGMPIGGGSTLPYVTAGITRADVRGFTDSLNGAATLDGWVAGVGVEHSFGGRWSAFAEYLHTDLGRMELPLGCGLDCFTDVSYGTIRAGLNWRF